MKQIFKDKKGQTLIEIIIAIAVGTLIITAILALATRSNRNSNLARASAQASKLAQGGLEIIKSIQDINTLGSVKTTPTATETDWIGLYAVDIDESDIFRLYNTSDPTCMATSWCIYAISSGVAEEIDLDGQIFTRRVEINDISTTDGCNESISFNEIKQFSVVVTWTDPVGEHEQRVVTCIRR